MIYKKPDEKFSHENITYTVGSRVLANEASEYSGLFGASLKFARMMTGKLKMIRRTSIVNLTAVPFRCPPRTGADFFVLYGAPKRVEDLGLELVIMAPEMLTPLAVPEQAYPQGTFMSSSRLGH